MSFRKRVPLGSSTNVRDPRQRRPYHSGPDALSRVLNDILSDAIRPRRRLRDGKQKRLSRQMPAQAHEMGKF
jgi:hypothetical protein